MNKSINMGETVLPYRRILRENKSTKEVSNEAEGHSKDICRDVLANEAINYQNSPVFTYKHSNNLKTKMVIWKKEYWIKKKKDIDVLHHRYFDKRALKVGLCTLLLGASTLACFFFLPVIQLFCSFNSMCYCNILQ